MEFQDFGKMGRFSRDIVITEKLDGTNAQVAIEEITNPERWEHVQKDPTVIAGIQGPSFAMAMRVGSRNRWITLGDDNYGFAKWAHEHRDELMQLGPGRHFGEWWGQGIQRGYGLGEKRFSLFNVGRWNGENIPACCSLVPIIHSGICSNETVNNALALLAVNGSFAAPGFMRPEGIIIYHTAAKVSFKKTLEDDGVPKSLAGRP